MSQKNRRKYFYPRPPRGGRLHIFALFLQMKDFYPRPPRGGRLSSRFQRSAVFSISTHALREEGDEIVPMDADDPEISTHALREEGDHPTSPCRPLPRNFYPRPPRGGRRPRYKRVEDPLTHFYPRPPRGGRRVPVRPISLARLAFLPTPSARRATQDLAADKRVLDISTHALREEGDEPVLLRTYDRE